MDDEQKRTIWCGNLNEKITEDLLYELFLQGGPLEKVTIPKDRSGKQRAFAFVTYKHECSVRYALKLFDGTVLYNRPLSLKLRDITQSQQEAQNQYQMSVYKQQDMNEILQYSNPMILNALPNMGMNMYPQPYMMPNTGHYYPQKLNMLQNKQSNYQNEDHSGYYQQNTNMLPNELNMTKNMQNFQNEERRNRHHPYYNRKEREPDNRDWDRDNRDRDNRDRINRDNNNINHDRDNRDDDRDSRYNVRSHKSKHLSHNSNKYGRRNYR